MKGWELNRFVSDKTETKTFETKLLFNNWALLTAS
jgi:hypothetical protein